MKFRCDCCQSECSHLHRVMSLDISSALPVDHLCLVCAQVVRSERAFKLAENPFSFDRLKADIVRQYSTGSGIFCTFQS